MGCPFTTSKRKKIKRMMEMGMIATMTVLETIWHRLPEFNLHKSHELFIALLSRSPFVVSTPEGGPVHASGVAVHPAPCPSTPQGRTGTECDPDPLYLCSTQWSSLPLNTCSSHRCREGPLLKHEGGRSCCFQLGRGDPVPKDTSGGF